MGNPAKDIRKQVRNVVQETLPQILTQELCNNIYKILQQEMVKKLAEVSEMIRKDLSDINQQNKSVQDYLMRAVEPKIEAPAVEIDATDSSNPPGETL